MRPYGGRLGRMDHPRGRPCPLKPFVEVYRSRNPFSRECWHWRYITFDVYPEVVFTSSGYESMMACVDGPAAVFHGELAVTPEAMEGPMRPAVASLQAMDPAEACQLTASRRASWSSCADLSTDATVLGYQILPPLDVGTFSSLSMFAMTGVDLPASRKATMRRATTPLRDFGRPRRAPCAFFC